MDLSDADLGLLMGHDTDPFNKWEASQKLAFNVLKRLVDESLQNNSKDLVLDELYL